MHGVSHAKLHKKRHGNPPLPVRCSAEALRAEVGYFPFSGIASPSLLYLHGLELYVIVYKYLYSVHILVILCIHNICQIDRANQSPSSIAYYHMELSHQSLPFSWRAFKMFS